MSRKKSNCQEVSNEYHDHILPPASPLRAQILSFLSPDSKFKASLINEHWYAAGGRFEAWSPDFHRDSLLRACCSRQGVSETIAHTIDDENNTSTGKSSKKSLPAEEVLGRSDPTSFTEKEIPVELDTPLMYMLMYRNATDPVILGRLETLLIPSLTTRMVPNAKFYEEFGHFFGNITTRFVTQFPLTHILLRHPRFLLFRSPPPPKAGYGTMPPYLFLIAAVTRWHEIEPMMEHVPWLISISRWAVTATDPATGRALPFHKLFLAPLVTILRSTTCRLQRIVHFNAIVSVAVALAHRYLTGAMFDDYSARKLCEGPEKFTKLDETNDDNIDADSALQQYPISEDGTEDDTEVAPSQPSDKKRAPMRMTDVNTKLPVAFHIANHRPPCDNVPVLLADSDPRLIFSVFYHLQRSFPRLRTHIQETIHREFSDFGIEQLSAAGRRVEYLLSVRRNAEPFSS